MKIKIDKFYQNTKGQQVEAGEHDASDLPSGLAQYLVDNGHAIMIEDDVPVKRVRADKTVTLADVDDSVAIDNTSEFDSLSAEYEALAGRKPSSNIKLETLRERVSEMQSES